MALQRQEFVVYASSEHVKKEDIQPTQDTTYYIQETQHTQTPRPGSVAAADGHPRDNACCSP